VPDDDDTITDVRANDNTVIIEEEEVSMSSPDVCRSANRGTF
jgi:hypothetical protein